MTSATRVVINTISQYIRIILGAMLMLYSTRIVLRELGHTDYALYSLLGSVLVFLSFIGSSLSKSTQRFLSYYAGANDVDYLRKVLLNSVVMHFMASIAVGVIVIALEFPLFSYILDISPDKILQARILYLFLVAGVFVTINSAPYLAVFISHENIVFSSAVYISLYILRLALALSLHLISPETRLIFYGSMMVTISAIEWLIYWIVATIKYEECRRYVRKKNVDIRQIFEFLKFSGWNMYGTMCVLARQQGYAVALNHFTGLRYNSGYGIASQISGQINNLVYSLSNAVSPLITKAEGGKDRSRMVYASVESSKIAFVSFIILGVPYYFFAMPILAVWLGDIPEATFGFSLIMILSCMMDSVSSGVRTGIFAIGNIKMYSIIVYTIKVSSIIFSIIVFICGGTVLVSMLPYLVSEIIGSIVTIKIFAQQTHQSFSEICKTLIGKTGITIMSSVLGCLVLKSVYADETLARSLISYFIVGAVVVVAAYFTALDERERKIIKNIFGAVCHRNQL